MVHLDNIIRMLDAYDESKKLPNGIRNDSAYNSYCVAIEIARKMCREDRLYRLEYDNPSEKLTFHAVVIGIKNDDFRDHHEIAEFISFLSLFESFSFFGRSDGNIEMELSLTIYE